HLDYNVANLNKIYPLIEVNWFHYTKGGKANDPGFGFEGADLVNFGSRSVGDRDLVTMAFGARYKFNENVQLCAAVEWPLPRHHNTIEALRLTLDLILRY